MDLENFFEKKINLFGAYYASILCKIFSGSRICNPFLSTTCSSLVIVENHKIRLENHKIRLD